VSNPAYAAASILLVNANFGCGSSREHAPQAIRRRGIRAVIGESYSEIFFGNAVALGMPCVSAGPEDVARLMELEKRTRRPSSPWTSSGCGRTRPASRWTCRCPGTREAFLEGSWDATGLLLDRYEEVEAVMRRLPYLTWGPRA
jgi:3-isopropylmalate/(R)-2-methylmalate dehydratase small subunit